MSGAPKTPKDAFLDLEEKLELLLGHLGNRREGLSEMEAALSSSTVRTRSGAARARTYNVGLHLPCRLLELVLS